MNNKNILYIISIMYLLISCAGVEEVGIKSAKVNVNKTTGKVEAMLPGFVIRSEDDETSLALQQENVNQTQELSDLDLLQQMEILKSRGFKIERIETDSLGNRKIIVTKPTTSIVILQPEQQSRSISVQTINPVDMYPQESLDIPKEQIPYNNQEGLVLLQRPSPIPTATPFPKVVRIIEVEKPTPTPVPTQIVETVIDPETDCLNKEFGEYGGAVVYRLRQLEYTDFTTCDTTLFGPKFPIPIVFLSEFLVFISPERIAEIKQLQDKNWRIITIKPEEAKEFFDDTKRSKVTELLKCYYEN